MSYSGMPFTSGWHDQRNQWLEKEGRKNPSYSLCLSILKYKKPKHKTSLVCVVSDSYKTALVCVVSNSYKASFVYLVSNKTILVCMVSNSYKIVVVV